MYDLEKKIDQFSESLFFDLGLSALPEEQKAEIYARLEDHLHKVILDILKTAVTAQEAARAERAMDKEDYRELARILKQHKELKDGMEQKIEQEYHNLKSIIAEEQKRERK